MLPDRQAPGKKAGLSYWANRVLEECDKASRYFAADPVHDLRVAIRRCRSMADGFLSVDPDPQWKEMKRLGKPLFSSLGELRDTQVMAEWIAKLSEPGDLLREKLLVTLAGKESELKAAAQKALESFDRKRWAALNAHLAKRTDRVPLEGPVFQHLALERWMEAHQRHRQAMRNRSQVGYHQLRIGIKRFRYTVENFLPERHEKWSGDLRDLQDALGEVHDFDVLRLTVRAQSHDHPEERAHWLKRILEERQKRLDLYRGKMLGKHSLWLVWRSELPTGPALEQAAMEKLRSWASFLDPDCTHSAHVGKIALQLYDALAQDSPLVSAPEYRRLLQAAAILHEVGRSKDGNGHQKRSYRMISRLQPPLGWSEEEMRCVAVAARYHQGPLPQTSDSYFVGLSAKRRSGLLPIIAILRLANAMDFEHDQSIARVSLERQNGAMTLYASGLQEISPSAERIARARYLLETVLRTPIIVRPLPAKRAASSRATGTRRRAAGAS
ncbi:MAG: CHAD domain-containing protein [Candidatus Korobacteraceae bacterium]